MTKSEDAIGSFRGGFTCSSAVFYTFPSELCLDAETARKCACDFGAGISKTGSICGAVSGAIPVIGLKYGKTQQGDDGATEKTRALVREIMQHFVKSRGSVNRTELPGYDLSDPAEYDQARRKRPFSTT